MRQNRAVAEFSVIVSSPLSRSAVKRSRWVAGTMAALGSAALFQVSASMAQASTLPPTGHPSAKETHTSAPAAGNTPTDAGQKYVIAKGDILWNIAARLHVSVQSLAALNGIANADRIHEGDTLTVPTVNAIQVGRISTVTNLPASKVDSIVVETSKGHGIPAGLAARPDRLRLQPQFKKAAASYKVPFDLLQAMTWNESGWQNTVRSSVGAVGIGQLMPDTVDFVNQQLLNKNLDPTRPDHNIEMSAAFLGYLLAQTNNDSRLALAAYYQGLASVRRVGLLPETQQYVSTVLAVQKRYF